MTTTIVQLRAAFAIQNRLIAAENAAFAIYDAALTANGLDEDTELALCERCAFDDDHPDMIEFKGRQKVLEAFHMGAQLQAFKDYTPTIVAVVVNFVRTLAEDKDVTPEARAEILAALDAGKVSDVKLVAFARRHLLG